jgi:hypothetical protein
MAAKKNELAANFIPSTASTVRQQAERQFESYKVMIIPPLPSSSLPVLILDPSLQTWIEITTDPYIRT